MRLTTIIAAACLYAASMSSGFAQQVESDRESAPAASQGANYFTLEVCNSNRRKIFIALSSKDAPGARDWYVAGWWNVEPGECRNLGRYPRPSIYLHAEDSGGGRWNGPDVRICVEKQKFKRVNYGNHKCSGPQLRGFYKKTITSDKFTWRLTPG